ncbi:PAS domain-containing sensor histidine kinase [Ferruginibacter sp.]|nr:PAS domain S-box protein [Ferruginibacter sp.]
MVNLISADFELSTFFEITPDLVCVASKDGFFKKVNLAVIAKLGYTKEELYTRPIASFVYEEDKEITRKTRKELLEGKALINFSNRYVTKSGKIIWLEWTSIYFAESEVVFAIAKDITERKRVEQEVEDKYIKFKSLATHFKSRIEKDKKFMAYELHEELAQLVAVLKMDVDWIAKNEPQLAESSKNRLEHALAVSKMLIKSIQRISFSISPGMLDEFGLSATLQWLCNEFSLMNGIPCNFKSEYNEENLTHEMRIDFFRICQEALTNVTYHAEASNVNVSIEDMGSKIQLTIVDDGKGFDITQQEDTPGLISIRERAASINGQLNVDSKIGAGTKISVAVTKQPSYN